MPSKSKCKWSVPPRYRDDTDDSSAATRQRTVSDADASEPAPQASPSSVDHLTTQLTALQYQIEAMQDVVLGVVSSIHSSA